MIVIRPVAQTDLDALVEMGRMAGAGMTTLPPNPEALSKRIAASVASFAADPNEPGGEVYWLIMEDLERGEPCGTAAIYAGVGLDRPFYSYRIFTLMHSSPELDVHKKMRVLILTHDFTGATEVGTLFLDPAHRRDRLGQFLSRSRYILVAAWPQRFGDKLFAEMRGWLDAEGASPVWEYLGRPFLGVAYGFADRLSASGNPRFIADLMPKHPIYVGLLPEAAREAIGKPHDDSAPALALLRKEGFRDGAYVDIFDGGPTVEASPSELRTVRESRVVRLDGEDGSLPPEGEDEGWPSGKWSSGKWSSGRWMIAVADPARLRIVRARPRFIGEDRIALAPDAIAALGAAAGDALLISPFDRDKP